MPRIVRRIIENITITTWTVTWDEIVTPAPQAGSPSHPVMAAPAPPPDEQPAETTAAPDSDDKG
jgi:hypothetical protein